MSAIDCTQHKLIGFLKAGYTYYIVDAQHMNDEFNTGYIYIGDGSGEHPALCVSKDIFQVYVVEYSEKYIHEWIEDGDTTLYTLIQTKIKFFDTPDFFYEHYYFNNNEWPVSTWSKIHTYIQGAKLERHVEADLMLAHAVGQFLIDNCQNLRNPDLVAFYNDQWKNFTAVYPLEIVRATNKNNYSKHSIPNATTI